MDFNATFPGDEIIQDAVMVYNQTLDVNSTPAQIFPWLMQIGKGRGGWYLTTAVERILPQHWRASHRIEEKWQQLSPGDRVEDYGFDAAGDFFTVSQVDPPKALVFASERYGCAFSWALLLHELQSASSSQPKTTVHLRFRGRIQATGLKRWSLVHVVEWLDWAATRPMLAGLKQRCEGSGHAKDK